MFATIKNVATSPFTKELAKVAISTTVISAASTAGVLAGFAIVGKTYELVEERFSKKEQNTTPAE